MAKEEKEKMMGVEELAERLGVGIKTARRLLADRKISYIQYGKRHRVLISERQLEEFLNEYEVPALKGGEQAC